MTDEQRIDWLEKFINEHGAIVLHDGEATGLPLPGLGLRPGYLVRTLREAIDTAARHEPAAAAPQEPTKP